MFRTCLSKWALLAVGMAAVALVILLSRPKRECVWVHAKEGLAPLSEADAAQLRSQPDYRRALLWRMASLVASRQVGYYRAVATKADKRPRLQSTVVDSGEMIVAGFSLVGPFHVELADDFVAVNGVIVEPRCVYLGDLHKRLSVSDTHRARGRVADAIQARLNQLQSDSDDPRIIAGRLAEYARDFELVQSAEIVADGVIVKARSVREGGRPYTFFYSSRRRRPPQDPTATKAKALRKSYEKICTWLRDGRCVYIPARGSMRSREPGLCEKIRGVVVSPPLSARLGECTDALDAVGQLLGRRVEAEEAAGILANWHHGLLFKGELEPPP